MSASRGVNAEAAPAGRRPNSPPPPRTSAGSAAAARVVAPGVSEVHEQGSGSLGHEQGSGSLELVSQAHSLWDAAFEESRSGNADFHLSLANFADRMRLCDEVRRELEVAIVESGRGLSFLSVDQTDVVSFRRKLSEYLGGVLRNRNRFLSFCWLLGLITGIIRRSLGSS